MTWKAKIRCRKEGVKAEFAPPREKLTFPLIVEGEVNLQEISAEPLIEVTKVLEASNNFQEVADNPPDIEVTNI